MAAIHFEDLLRIIHSLAAAAWFGAMVYRTFCVDPRLRSLLGAGAAFEHASLHLAHGMRYVVLTALLTCGLTGFVLAGLRWTPSESWLSWMAGKTLIWFVAFSVFAYVSWVFWPKRVFADAAEWSNVRRQGLKISLLMIGLAGLGFILGQLGQTARLST